MSINTTKLCVNRVVTVPTDVHEFTACAIFLWIQKIVTIRTETQAHGSIGDRHVHTSCEFVSLINDHETRLFEKCFHKFSAKYPSNALLC